MIDLHLHTNYSDGTDSVIELLKKAEDKKLEYIAITDHNTCMAYDELEKIDARKYYTGTIIEGVELTTKVNGIPIELLGYGVDPKIINKEAKTMYADMKNKNDIEYNHLKNICKTLNITLDEELPEKYDKTKYIYSSTYVHEQIHKHQENRKYFMSEEAWNDPMEFYRREMSNKKSKFYIDNTKILPTIQQVIDLIREAGGLVFVPHIYQYKDNTPEIFNEIKQKYEVDGYECYYSKFTKEQTEFMLDFCKNNNLYISGGSDYHGKTKPNIDIGTGIKENLEIQSEILTPWIDKVLK